MHIVMTGATAGIGLEAALQLSAAGRADILVGARTPAAAPTALKPVATLLEVCLLYTSDAADE